MATPEQIAIWTARLAAAETAFHEWSIGNHKVLVQLDGRRVGYSEVNGKVLLDYINRLRALLAGASPGRGRITYPTPY